jgi:tetratricopeptide (TPR) repeat protein
MEQGQVVEGLEYIRASKKEHADSTLLGAIGELVELRLYARIGQYPDPGSFLTRCVGKIGKALVIRAELAQALAPDFNNMEAVIENFRDLTLRLGALPDINGLGTAYNALGVLFRRNRQLDLAERYLRYAAALLVASFDLPTLQAALFNLGHTMYKRGAKGSDLQEALGLISLDREICYALGIGKDSAQAEIVAGTICVKLGEVERAEHWLGEGQQIVRVLPSDYNKAGLERLHGRILWTQAWREEQDVSPERRSAILSSFREAQRLLGRAGFPSRGLEYEMGLVRNGQGPPWATG